MGMQNQRQVYGETLVKLGEVNDRICVTEADLGKSTMSCLFKARFPERYFEMGISEADMTSFAAGLALSGKIAFTNSFACFSGGRAYDQIRMSVCTAKLNVKIMGSSAGLSDFGDGATHQSVDDVAIMRAIPNLTVLAPCDGIEVEKAVKAMVDYDGPVYIRVCRNPLPDVFPQDQEFKIGQPVVLRDGSDVVVFAYGKMVSLALEAAEELAKEGVSVKVVNVSTLKPFNDEAIKALSAGMKGVVTAEEHSVIGGLGSAVCYALRGCALPINVVGVEDKFGQSAHTYEELLEYYGLTSANIKAQVKAIIG